MMEPRRTSDVLIEIPATPRYLQMVRSVVAAAASIEPDLSPQRIHDLRLAVSEATTNAIEAQLEAGSDERVGIRLNLDDERIEVEIVDHGLGFDPNGLTAVPEPDTPERLDHESGLGVPLMRVLADVAEITSEEDGTKVRLVVYVPRRGL